MTGHSGKKKERRNESSVVVTFREMKKGTGLDLQPLPLFQLHLHTPAWTKISKQLLVFIKKNKPRRYLTYIPFEKTLILQRTL